MYKFNGNELTINGKTLVLKQKQVLLFSALAEKSPSAIKKDDLMNEINVMSEHSLRQHVNTLRKLIDNSGIKIITHMKFGYAMKKNEVEK